MILPIFSISLPFLVDGSLKELPGPGTTEAPREAPGEAPSEVPGETGADAAQPVAGKEAVQQLVDLNKKAGGYN